MPPFFRHSLVLIFALLALSLSGQQIPNDILDVEFFSSREAAVAGETIEIALVVNIQRPWHVYAPVGNDDFTIPISASISQEDQPFSLGDWLFPTAQRIAVAGVEEPAAVYGDRIVLRNTLTVNKNAEDSLVAKGEVYFQACDDAQCLIPATVTFNFNLPVVASGTNSQAINSELFVGTTNLAQSSSSPVDEEDDDISGLVDQYGLLLTYFFIFMGGLALNLTPCVYPLIPITISFFGGKETSKGRTFWMALAYVLGIAVTYSILGVAAALGGGLFGALLTNPFVLIGIAAILVGLSLSMFGVYEIRVPTGLMTAASQSKAGIFGSFFMGLTLGIVAAPCVGPFVIGLLTYVAAQQSVVLGFTMFFTLAMGLGLPYLFLAMYSSKLSSLPRSGNWMNGVRIIFGLILIAMAIYFLMPLLGEFGSLVMALFLVGSGIYLIMFDSSAEGNKGFNKVKQVISILLIMIGTWMGMPEPENVGESIVWERPTSLVELYKLLAMDDPLMIDVYADWCIPCKEMDKFTFVDPEVVKLSKKFTAVKIDMTKQNGEFEKQFLERFSIMGVPTYLFINAGEENGSLRSTGFENAKDFLIRMKSAL
ncbi:MAG: thioredoxin family protein [Candidatus Marinimicrobia bacterium]|nr:thioredoxin family protein [Candidatus Neomarinimicrobiota bacterium]